MPDEKKAFDLEEVYDKEIAPLMSSIISICQRHKLPMFATFLYANDPADQDGFCTTQLLFEQERPIPDKMFKLNPLIRGEQSSPLRVRVTKKDGSVEDIVILP